MLRLQNKLRSTVNSGSSASDTGKYYLRIQVADRRLQNLLDAGFEVTLIQKRDV